MREEAGRECEMKVVVNADIGQQCIARTSVAAATGDQHLDLARYCGRSITHVGRSHDDASIECLARAGGEMSDRAGDEFRPAAVVTRRRSP